MGGFVYMFLGTIKEVTIGPTSLMAIVTFQFTRDLNIHFVMLLTFLTGVIQFAMGVLRLGGYIVTPILNCHDRGAMSIMAGVTGNYRLKMYTIPVTTGRALGTPVQCSVMQPHQRGSLGKNIQPTKRVGKMFCLSSKTPTLNPLQGRRFGIFENADR